MSVTTTARSAARRSSPRLRSAFPAGDTGNGVARVEHEERDCPHCGTELKRAVGGAWFLATETELP